MDMQVGRRVLGGGRWVGRYVEGGSLVGCKHIGWEGGKLESG
jgi:hypothetical protein